MNEELFHIIKDNFGLTAALLVLLVVGLVCGAWWASKIYNRVKSIDSNKCDDHSTRITAVEGIKDKFDRHIDGHDNFAASVAELKGSVSGLKGVVELMQRSMETMQRSIEKLMDGRDTMQRSMETMQRSIEKSLDERLEVMQDKIESLFADRMKDPLIESHSPIRVSKRGREVADRLGAEEMIGRNWERINKIIEEAEGDKTPYDIHELCTTQAVMYPESILEKEDIRRIKMEAFNAGTTTTPILDLIGVMIRDRYFLEHDIHIKEIDAQIS